jgi:hypothetical protein
MIDPFLLSAMRQAAASCAPQEVFLRAAGQASANATKMAEFGGWQSCTTS